ncbi:hypothetical protein BLOT_008881 [Blomia tropicalis]|nr:hypothetical protein BLOT_008881 [Blomia tropicalis]
MKVVFETWKQISTSLCYKWLKSTCVMLQIIPNFFNQKQRTVWEAEHNWAAVSNVVFSRTNTDVSTISN